MIDSLEETERDFLAKMEKRYEENKNNPELLAHRIDYLFHEFIRISKNEIKILKGCNQLDNRIEKLESQSILINSKKPYKCPTCECYCHIIVNKHKMDQHIQCINCWIQKRNNCSGCKGTGIVWD